MKTHAIITFSNSRIKVSKAQAEFVMDMLKPENKSQIGEKDYLRFDGQMCYLKSISDVIELPYDEREIIVHKLPALPEPKNRYTRQQNLERMWKSAIEARMAEQAKYGQLKGSVSIDQWVPSKYKHLLHSTD